MAAKQVQRRLVACPRSYWFDRELARRLIVFKRPSDVDLLADFCLEGNDRGAAIEIAEFPDFRALLLEPLIGATEELVKTGPRAAAAQFRRMAEICVRRRGRIRYKQACTLLIRARDLPLESANESNWQRLIEDLQQCN